MPIITNEVNSNSRLKLVSNSYNADFNDIISHKLFNDTLHKDAKNNTQNKDILLDSWQKLLVRTKRSPADREDADPARENRNEVLENIKHSHFGFLLPYTQELIYNDEANRIRHANVYRATLRINNRSDDEVNLIIQRGMRRLISQLIANPVNVSARAALEKNIVLFPEQFESLLREGRVLPGSINSRVRFALSSGNYLVISAIPRDLRHAYSEYQFAQGEAVLSPPDQPGNEQRIVNSPEIPQELALFNALSEPDSDSASSGYSSLKNVFGLKDAFDEDMHFVEERNIPIVPLSESVVNNIQSVLQGIINARGIFFADIANIGAGSNQADAQSMQSQRQHLNSILETADTISMEDLVNYIQNNEQGQSYQHLDNLLDAYAIINKQISIDTEIPIAYMHAIGRFNSNRSINSLYNKLQLTINFVARRGILENYVAEYRNIAELVSRVNRILNTRYSNAINFFFNQNSVNDNFLLRRNYPFDTEEAIAMILESRCPAAIDFILNFNFTLLKNYILTPSGTINDQHIGRFLRTRHQRAITAILDSDALTNYINEIRGNSEQFFFIIGQILISKNSRAINSILPYLEEFINSALDPVRREVYISIVLNTRHSDAVDLLVNNNILTNSFLMLTAGRNVRSLFTTIILQSGSKAGIRFLFQTNQIENYVNNINNNENLRRFTEEMVQSGVREAIEFLFRRHYIEDYINRISNNESRHKFIGAMVQSNIREAIDFICQEGYIEDYANSIAAFTDKEKIYTFVNQMFQSGSTRVRQFILRHNVLRDYSLNPSSLVNFHIIRIKEILETIASAPDIISSPESKSFLKKMVLDRFFSSDNEINLETLLQIADSNQELRTFFLEDVLNDYVMSTVISRPYGHPIDALLHLFPLFPWLINNVTLWSQRTITDYINTGADQYIRNERIERILISGNVAAIHVIYSQGLLDTYVDSTRINPITHAICVEMLLTLANSNAEVEQVLLRNDVLNNYVLQATDGATFGARVEKILTSGNAAAINVIYSQRILDTYVDSTRIDPITHAIRVERLLTLANSNAEIMQFLLRNNVLNNYVLHAPDNATFGARVERLLTLANSNSEITQFLLRNNVLNNYVFHELDGATFRARVEKILTSGNAAAINVIYSQRILDTYVDSTRIDPITHAIRVERLLTLANSNAEVEQVLLRNDVLNNYVLHAPDDAIFSERVERILTSGNESMIGLLTASKNLLPAYILNAANEAIRDERINRLKEAGVSQDKLNKIISSKHSDLSEKEPRSSLKRARPEESSDDDDINYPGPSASQCLSGASGSGQRRKRALVTKGCHFDEEDIKKINKGKEKPKKPSDLIIESDELIKLLEHIETSELKRNQLIELASKAPQLVGSDNAQARIKGLIKNHKAFRYLDKAVHISGMVMGGMMWKNFLVDLYNGNYAGAGINAAFIVSGPASKALQVLGSKLILNGKYIRMGNTFVIGAPFLMQTGTLGFVIYDLVNQIKRFKHGDSDALVKIVTDGLVIGLQGSEIAISSALSLELIAASSAINVSIRLINITVTIIFVGTDIYLAVRQVKKEDKLIHLTGDEKLLEGIRHFVGIGSDGKLARLMQEKQGNNQIFNESISFLKNNNTEIQQIIVPTASLKKVCHDERQAVSWKCDTTTYFLSGPCRLIPDKYQTVNVCNDQVTISLNNEVELDEKLDDIRWSRTRPDVTEGRLFCAPQDSDDGEIPSEGKVYRCDKAMGIEYAEARTGNATLINLGDGHDNVEGFSHGNHIVIVGNDHKNIKLGNGDDNFILNGNHTWGVLQGGSGINTLDATFFAQNETTVFVDLSGTPVIYTSNTGVSSLLSEMEKQGSSSLLRIESIQRLFLRENKKDYINVACNTLYINGQGGKNRGNCDEIFIDAGEVANCRHNMELVIGSNTEIDNYNNNKNSEFTYIIPSKPIESELKAVIRLKSDQSLHCFLWPEGYSLSDIKKFIKKNSLNNNEEMILHIEFGKKLETAYVNEVIVNKLYIQSPNASNLLFKLNDNTSIINQANQFFVYHTTNRSVTDTINDYASQAKRLHLTVMAYFLATNETLTIGSGEHGIFNSNPDCRSHLIGNGGENVFVITPPNSVLSRNQLPLPEVVLYDNNNENLIDTLELDLIREKIEKDLGLTIKIKNKAKSARDITINLYWLEEKNEIEGTVLRIRLKDALETQWHKRLHIHFDGTLMKFAGLNLKPLPLEFITEDQIYIYPETIKMNQMLIIHKQIGNTRFARLGNTLLISNAFDMDIAEDERYFISLNNFYIESKLATLSIQFKDKLLVLRDESEAIASAPNYSDSDAYKQSYDQQNVKYLNLSNSVRLRRSHPDVHPKIIGQHQHQEQKMDGSPWDWIKSTAFYGLLFTSTIALFGLFGIGGLRLIRRLRRRHAMPLAVPVASVEMHLLANSANAKLVTKEEVGLAHLNTLDRDRVIQVNECRLGVRYGDKFVTGITCAIKNAEVMVFLKESDVKLTKSEDKLFKESCRPVEFDGRPSVYCEGEESNIVYTPDIFEPPLERITGILMLSQVGLNLGKKFYNYWWKSFFAEKKTVILPQKVSITAEQKTTWIELLIDIETQLADLALMSKLAERLDWVWNILEDRIEEYQKLSKKSQVDLEEVVAMTEALKVLQTELEEIKDFVLTPNSDDQKGTMQKQKIFNDLNPGLINTPLLSNSATNQKIGFKASTTPSFFKHYQTDTRLLPIQSMMNNSMSNAL